MVNTLAAHIFNENNIWFLPVNFVFVLEYFGVTKKR